jgi:hemolysin III
MTGLLHSPPPAPVFSLGEEIAHAVSHGIGAVLAIVGLAVLVATASLHGDRVDVATCAVYGTTLILLYLASTVYHSIPRLVLPRTKQVLQVLDHTSIYLLIAGTYTPWTLGPLRGPWGFSLFAVVWTAAILGILAKTLAFHRGHQPHARGKALSIVLYVGMGWCVLAAFAPLRRAVEAGGIVLLVAGGVAYTAGVIFYNWKKLRYHHFVWHLFVLAGSILHFFAVLFYVLPRA